MKIIKKLIIIIIVIALIAVGIVGGKFVYEAHEMYKQKLEEIPIEEKISEIRSKENYTKLEEIPQIYKNAVLAVEDHRFYSHGAIDIISIGRAIYKDITTRSFAEGGSTITQQLAKNTYFTQEKKMSRKISEIFMAREYEKNLTKDEILELYINTCYFGNGYYSLKEASKGYFNKEAKDMTDYECIMLAGIPNAPSVYAPTKNLELAKQRQKQVADAMVAHGYIKQDEVDKILKKEE